MLQTEGSETGGWFSNRPCAHCESEAGDSAEPPSSWMPDGSSVAGWTNAAGAVASQAMGLLAVNSSGLRWAFLGKA